MQPHLDHWKRWEISDGAFDGLALGSDDVGDADGPKVGDAVGLPVVGPGVPT